MGLIRWFKKIVRQVVDDDLEGTGAKGPSTDRSPRRASVRAAETELGHGADKGASETREHQAVSRADRGDADDEAAAAWVVYNDNNSGRGDRE